MENFRIQAGLERAGRTKQIKDHRMGSSWAAFTTFG